MSHLSGYTTLYINLRKYLQSSSPNIERRNLSCAKKITYLTRDGFQGEEGRSHESNDRESVERCQGTRLSYSSDIDKVFLVFSSLHDLVKGVIGLSLSRGW